MIKHNLKNNDDINLITYEYYLLLVVSDDRIRPVNQPGKFRAWSLIFYL
jgi:hypothetical protein